MLNATEKNRQNAGSMGTFQVGWGISYHPYVMARGNSRAVQRQENWIRGRLVALGVLGAHGPHNPPIPAQVSQFGAQVRTHLVADHRDVAAEGTGALQEGVCTGQRLEALEML
jgi:hypothetical protein